MKNEKVDAAHAFLVSAGQISSMHANVQRSIDRLESTVKGQFESFRPHNEIAEDWFSIWALGEDKFNEAVVFLTKLFDARIIELEKQYEEL